MKRKGSTVDEEESRLSSLLFNKSKKFAENLPNLIENEPEVDLKPVWIDDDDELHGTNIIPRIKNDDLYVHKLKKKYETLVGTPNWAKLKDKSKENEDDDDSKLLRTVGHLQKNKLKSLRKGVLEIQNYSRINKETSNEGPIISNVEFHPKASVVLVAGNAGVVSLFSITGKYTKLHSFQLKKWKITSVQFIPDGSKAYIASKIQPNYCIYDLVTAEPTIVQLPRIVKRPKLFLMSPNGKLIATNDGCDEVHIICAESKELLRSLKHNTNLASIAFSHDSTHLICYGVDGEIVIWSLSIYRVLKKFQDHGCVTASHITTSSCGNLLATGSGEGIVNIYDATNLTISDQVPIKTISNLRTRITNLRFNATSEILALSSNCYPNAVKLVHIPSYHVFTNFPQLTISNVNTISFSPNSGYMALGNNKNCAYLYRLKHFKNY